jgi:hypothetical protein
VTHGVRVCRRFMLKSIFTGLFVFFALAVPALTFGQATSSTPPFAANLQLWDRGSEVLSLQQFLNQHGFPVSRTGAGSSGQETDFFGLKTYAALVKFQAAEGLPATGFFGPLTRAAIARVTATGAPTNAQTTASSTPPATTFSGIPQLIPLPAGYTPGYGGGGGTAGSGTSGGGSSSDTTPPTVSLTAPTNGATVSGTAVALSATASDNVAVASVQFKADGTNIGSAAATSPYSTTWNSKLVADGSHTIAAVAEDTSGNYATSSIGVTVDNTPPVISTISVSTTTTTSSSAVITWTTNEAASSTVSYGITSAYGTASSSAAFTTSHSITLTALASGTIYHFQIAATDNQGNLATSSDATFTTQLAPGALIGMIGDSIAEYEFNTGPTLAARQTGLQIYNAGTGPVTSALAIDPAASLFAWNDLTDNTALLTNEPRYYSSGDVGRAGAQLSDIDAEITREASYGPNILIVEGGTNSLSDSNFAADDAKILDDAHTAMPNAIIGVENISAVAVSMSGTRSAASIQAANALIAANVAARPWAELIDEYTPSDNDPSNPGYGLAADYGDGLHPNILGAETVFAVPLLSFIEEHVASGNAITARKITSVLPPGTDINAGSQSSSHTSTTGATISGVVPAGMDVAYGAAGEYSSITTSLQPNPSTGGQILIITVTPAGTSTSESLAIRPQFISIATTTLQSQWARAWAQLECDQGNWIRTTLNVGEKSNSSNNLMQTQLGLYPEGSGMRTVYPITPSLQFSATSTGLVPSIALYWNPSLGGGPYTCKLEQWDVQTEASPVRP